MSEQVEVVPVVSRPDHYQLQPDQVTRLLWVLVVLHRLEPHLMGMTEVTPYSPLSHLLEVVAGEHWAVQERPEVPVAAAPETDQVEQELAVKDLLVVMAQLQIMVLAVVVEQVKLEQTALERKEV
jgi:hypothetical protein